MTEAEDHLLAELDAAGIAYQVHEHDAVFTVEESAALHEAIAGAHTKNLFLRNDKGGYWLVTLPHDRRADLKHIGKAIGAGRLSFGKPEAMVELIGVTPGAVTPLAAINDGAGRVTVVLDAAFNPAGTINVHPLRNTATLSLRTGDLLALLERWGHQALVADLQPPQG